MIFGAEKTKVTVTGSRHDIQYYKDINIWSLYGEKLNMSEDNEHLGQVVSGIDEERKNVDKNIMATRDTLFGFLGNIFSYKFKLSQAVRYHTWSVFIIPVLVWTSSSPQKTNSIKKHHHIPSKDPTCYTQA